MRAPPSRLRGMCTFCCHEHPRRFREMQTDHDLIGFNNYISPTIVGPCPLRPRPIVLMISRDVPSYASQKIIESLLSNLQVCRV
jgi:hypothetical protein